jgi:3-hydroxy-5-methyl-1-naphthoate 3-O-methyltransferase
MPQNPTTMFDFTRAPSTDPTALYARRDGLYASDMLFAAVNGLDFFTWLDAHPATIDDITRQLGLHRRPVDVMTTLFVAMGLIDRDGPVLRASAVAREHLVSGSPWFLGPYYPKLSDRPIARDLIEVLRTGQPARFAGRADEADWHRAMETESFAEEFTAAMDCRGLVTGQALAQHLDLSQHRRLLDIAGGSGVFACAMAARFPALRASVLEKPPVDRIAAGAVGRRGFAARVEVIAGDMLSGPLPAGHDVHLFSNVLHDWAEEVVRALLRASSAALPAGGRLVIHETFLNPEKTGPLDVAEYSVLLMHVCQGRCYSIAEMEGWMSEAGFSMEKTVPSAAGRSALVGVREARVD